MVAASVIILRYQPASSCQFKLKQPETDAPTPGDPLPDASDKQSMLKQSQVQYYSISERTWLDRHYVAK